METGFIEIQSSGYLAARAIAMTFVIVRSLTAT